MSKTVLLISALLFAFILGPASAQDSIPQTSGFSGLALAVPGYFKVETNLVASGAPLLDDASNEVISSIFLSPESKSVAGLLAGGEIDYTFAGTRTQLFLGNRLEDILRLDIVLGLGIRQELPDKSILAASVLATPLYLKVWSDPYVENQPRTKTEVNQPGGRLRWGRILGTGLELTGTYRRNRIDSETSGDWLVSQGRLTAAEQPLLNRDGDAWILQALYRIDAAKTHRFEPAVRYRIDDRDGAAMASKGLAAQLTYLYRTPKLILDFNAALGQTKADAVNPVYGQRLETDRYGISLTAFIPIKRFDSSVLNLMIGGEILRENANIAFFDTSISAVNIGLLWRHIKQ